MPDIEIKNLTYNYGAEPLFNRFDFSVGENERVAILGASGCGKTTLLNLIAGLLRPQEGSISVRGRLLFSSTEKFDLPPEKRKIGFVFQEYSLWQQMTVFRNVAYPLKLRKIDRQERRTIVMEMLARVGLEDKADNYPQELSGGEMQRVAIVRALATNPDLLLLDEPLANIDAVLKDTLLDLFTELQMGAEIPLIYVTHDQKEAFRIADRILLLHKGQVVQYGTPEELYNSPQNLYAAEFIGDNNILAGAVLGRAEAYLAVRPEDIVPAANGEYSAEIAETVFRGEYLEVKLDFRGTMLKAHIRELPAADGNMLRFNIKHICSW